MTSTATVLTISQELEAVLKVFANRFKCHFEQAAFVQTPSASITDNKEANNANFYLIVTLDKDNQNDMMKRMLKSQVESDCKSSLGSYSINVIFHAELNAAYAKDHMESESHEIRTPEALAELSM